MQAKSFGNSNCTGLRTLAASANVCNGFKASTGIGIGGGVLFFIPLFELPLLVDDVSSSFCNEDNSSIIYLFNTFLEFNKMYNRFLNG